MNKFISYLHHLKSNWAIFIGAAAGIHIGLNEPQLIKVVSPLGQFYLDMLTMCVLPILLTAIALSIGRLLNQPDSHRFVSRLSWVFLGGIFAASATGTFFGMMFNPGSHLDTASLDAIGNVIQDLSAVDLAVDLNAPYQPPKDSSLLQAFFFTLVPSNIFSALANGYTIKVLFFAILFGFAIGTIKHSVAEHICTSFEAIYSAFSKLVQWLMYVFPFGLCGLLAATLSQIGSDAILAMIKFIPVVILTFIGWFVLMCLVLWHRTGTFWYSLSALKEPITVSLGTANSMASLPSALNALIDKFGYQKQKVDLLVPLTFNLCRIGPTLYFALATVFVVQIYNLDIGLLTVAVIIIGSVLAGTATAGSSGVSMLTMLTLVSGPLGLPLDAVLVLFVVIDPIVAPFRVLAIVHSSCAIISVVLPKPDVQQNALSERSQP
ncbi:dicarboxylate/amino acid:cation symporter [Pseudoalteromonas rubra]|uniref:dicarboxylate/amino acid:cation symporter n=1 Tax=Pseudoalteromonas rubra TaxID=43658 RepID=UPI0013DE5DCF|nr:cation:dicarboxylase symporter family transporter [Pseudoalteromonas rubra]